MPKRVLFSKSQQDLINESINIGEAMSELPRHLVDDIRSGSVPFSDIPIEKIAGERFLKVKSEFSDDITKYDTNAVVAELNKLVRKVLKKEKLLKKQLETICVNNVAEAFKMPEDGIKFGVELTEKISNSQQFQITPDVNDEYEYEDVNEIETDDMETKKRKLIDALIVGASKSICEVIQKKCLRDIFEIDEELPHLYSKIMKINDYLIFTEKFKITDKSHKQGGYVNVKLGSDIFASEITAVGIIFPILLYEAIKGCMELWASHGLPDDAKKAFIVINNADALENDPWYTRIGPVLWDRICGDNEFEELKYIPSFIYKIASIDANNFCSLIKEVAYNTKAGKREIQKLISDVKYNDDYSDFEYDLKAKQSEKGLVTDDEYFTEKELEEAAYPSNFNMEEFKSLSSFKKRVAYCQERLKRLGAGSSRIVFMIDDNTVLKLAKNTKGVAQNNEESKEAQDFYLHQIGLFAEVYDYDENGLWIECEYCRPAKASDFKKITGYDFSVIQDWISYVYSQYTRNPLFRNHAPNPIFNTEEFEDNFEYSLFQSIQDYMGNYGAEAIGDFKRLSSWGVNSKGELVIIDNGLTEEVFEKYYCRR